MVQYPPKLGPQVSATTQQVVKWSHLLYTGTCHKSVSMSLWSCWIFSQWSTLLSFLSPTHGIWWQLCRCQVCSCGHSHHPNSPLPPGTCDCRTDWTEGRQSPPKRQSRYKRESLNEGGGGIVWSLSPFPCYTDSFSATLKCKMLDFFYLLSLQWNWQIHF